MEKKQIGITKEMAIKLGIDLSKGTGSLTKEQKKLLREFQKTGEYPNKNSENLEKASSIQTQNATNAINATNATNSGNSGNSGNSAKSPEPVPKMNKNDLEEQLKYAKGLISDDAKFSEILEQVSKSNPQLGNMINKFGSKMGLNNIQNIAKSYMSDPAILKGFGVDLNTSKVNTKKNQQDEQCESKKESKKESSDEFPEEIMNKLPTVDKVNEFLDQIKVGNEENGEENKSDQPINAAAIMGIFSSLPSLIQSLVGPEFVDDGIAAMMEEQEEEGEDDNNNNNNNNESKKEKEERLKEKTKEEEESSILMPSMFNNQLIALINFLISKVPTMSSRYENIKNIILTSIEEDPKKPIQIWGEAIQGHEYIFREYTPENVELFEKLSKDNFFLQMLGISVAWPTFKKEPEILETLWNKSLKTLIGISDMYQNFPPTINNLMTQFAINIYESSNGKMDGLEKATSSFLQKLTQDRTAKKDIMKFVTKITGESNANLDDTSKEVLDSLSKQRPEI
jgi:hypothetical protein